jgi:zinc transport system substrate-binding protein
MRRAWILLGFLAATLGGCGRAARETDDRMLVAVSILPHQWLVQEAGGRHVRVLTLVQPGESAELYEPTDAQIGQVARAKIYFLAGVPLENGHALKAVQGREGTQVVDLLRAIARDEMLPPHDEGPREAPAAGPDAGDPHVWLCPRLLKIQARKVVEALCRVDPEHGDEYAVNLAELMNRLDRADEALRGTLAPFKGRAFFVFHPAWGYFAREYGLRQIAIETEGKQPTDRELALLQQQARREDARVFFVPP